MAVFDKMLLFQMDISSLCVLQVLPIVSIDLLQPLQFICAIGNLLSPSGSGYLVSQKSDFSTF